MRWYSGNRKRIIKKHCRGFSSGSVEYSWKQGLRLLEIVAKLQPGHICYIPYKGPVDDPDNWGIIEQVSFEFEKLWKVRGRQCWGFTIQVRDNTGKVYWVYDLEQWFFSWTGAQTIQFNRQIGLADDFHLRQHLINELPKVYWR